VVKDDRGSKKKEKGIETAEREREREREEIGDTREALLREKAQYS